VIAVAFPDNYRLRDEYDSIVVTDIASVHLPEAFTVGPPADFPQSDCSTSWRLGPLFKDDRPEYAKFRWTPTIV
jgi:hypothetical protein